MLGDINKNLEPKSYELILCKPDRTQITTLPETYGIVFSPKFAGIDEFELKIPYYVEDVHGQIKNPNWDLIRGDYLILLNNEQYFIIDSPKNQGDNSDYKVIHAYSQEYELGKKTVRKYEGTKKLYDIAMPEDGIMNYLTTLTSWSIDYIDPDLVNMYRTFDITEKTWLEVAEEVQKAFGCIFKYDTLNKSIDIFSIGEIGTNTGLYISEENYIKTFNEEIKHDNIVTRLYCYGKSNLTFNAVNSSGTNYIEDFSFYRVPEYMSEGLRLALDNYDALIESKQGEFSTLLTDLSDFRSEYNSLDNSLVDLQTQLDVIDQDIDIAIKNGNSLTSLNQQKNEKIREMTSLKIVADIISGATTNSTLTINIGVHTFEVPITAGDSIATLNNKIVNTIMTTNNTDFHAVVVDEEAVIYFITEKSHNDVSIDFLWSASGVVSTETITDFGVQNQMSSKEQEISSKLAEIDSLQSTLSKENNFTVEQITELDFYIRDKTWSNAHIFDEAELLAEGKKILQTLNQPPMEFDVDLLNFLQVVDCQHDWNKLVLGDIINIHYGNFDVDIQVRLIGYTHDPDSNGLKLQFSNKDAIDNPYVFLKDILKQAISTSTEIDMSKYKWDKSEDNESQIRQIIDSQWDAATNRVIAGRNQEVIINDRGISLTDSSEGDEYHRLHQLRMLNNVIAFTRDGWKSSSLAITPEGVYAEHLFGQIIAGENLAITTADSSFRVDNTGVTIDGGNLTITNGLPTSELSGENLLKDTEAYNGIQINTTDGFIATRSDGLNRTVINATDGIKIQKSDGAGGWLDKLYADTSGNLIAQDLTVNNINISGGIINWDAIDKPSYTASELGAISSTYIDENSIWTGNLNANNVVTGQLSADYINLKGLTITDGTNTTFAIDSGGNVTLGGNITWGNKPSYTAIEVGARSSTWTPSASEVGALPDSTSETARNKVFNALTKGGIVQGLFYDSILGDLYINAEDIRGTYLTGKTIRTASTGSRIEINGGSGDIISYNTLNQKHGYCISNDGQLDLWIEGTNVGEFAWDTTGAGEPYSAAKRLFLRSFSPYPLKIESGSNMSIQAPTGYTIYIQGNAHFSGGVVDLQGADNVLLPPNTNVTAVFG